MRKKELLEAAVDRRADEGLQNAWCQMVKKKYTYNENGFEYRFGRLIIADTIRVRQKEILQISMWIHGNNGGMVDVPKYYIFADRISIHSPSEGRDGAKSDYCNSMNISIHSPSEGRDF